MAGHEDNTTAFVGETLTRREREILALLAEGLTGPEIAARLTVANSSVKSHLQHLYSKLGVNSRRQAIGRAQALGLLTPKVEAAAVPAAPAAPTSPKHNLPQQLTRFFGREDDIARVQERLAEWRLVTLTG
jgi:DNA-binding CsgD family transcriptional regulator